MRDTVDPLRKCVAQLSRLPGVGERTTRSTHTGAASAPSAVSSMR